MASKVLKQVRLSMSLCFVFFCCPCSMHLKPLRRQLEILEECEYPELEKRIPALYHLVCLIWANSTHYQQPSRLVVLMQEISNFIIELV